MARGWKRAFAVVAASLLVTACTASPPPTPAPVRTAAPVATPPPTPPPPLAIDALPKVAVDPAVTTALCDPSRGDPNAHGLADQPDCLASLELAMGAIRAATADPVERLWYRHPPCAATACQPDELATATVIGWIGGTAYAVTIDTRLSTVGYPTADPGAAWPAAGDSPVPEVERVALPGATKQLRKRSALPFCGDTTNGASAEIRACFGDAVLAGRPAELIDRTVSPEGAPVTILLRFVGKGSPVEYVGVGKTWSRVPAALYLRESPGDWDLVPLPTPEPED